MGERRWAVAFLATGLATVLAMAGPEAAAEPITIAIAGPFSGPLAKAGEQMAAGARQAVIDLNRAGGLLGERLRLVTADDACTPSEAEAVARRLARQNVAMVDGHFCSAASIAAAPIYDRAGTIMISPASSNPALTELGLGNVFRVVPPDDEQARLVARYLGQQRPRPRVAVIGDGSDYGSGLAEVLVAELRKARRPAVLVRKVRQGQREFRAVADAIGRAGATTVFYGGFHSEAGRLARALAGLKRPPQLIGPDALETDLFWEVAGAAGEGTLVVALPDPTSRPAAQPVVRRLLAAEINPGDYVIPSYAAVQVWAQAVAEAGTTRAAAVRRVLKTRRLDTVLGSLRFTASGDPAAARLTLYRWRAGRLVPRDVS